MRSSRYVNDNVHGLIRCTCLETMVMQQAVFSRLHNVYQNSIAYLTWPSNRNQRFEHSVGTMKLAGDMLFASVANANAGVRRNFLDFYHNEIAKILDGIAPTELDYLFNNCQKQVRNIATEWKEGGVISTTNDIKSALAASDEGPLPDFSWRLVPGEVGKDRAATCYLLMESVRMAGMLHDIGHPPFSHAVEHALEDLHDAASGMSGDEVVKFRDAMERLKALGGKTHEGMGQLLIDELFRSVLKDRALDDSLVAIGMCRLKIEYYIIYKITRAILQDEEAFADIHAVVNSTIDADRLDFVRRDALCSGIGSDTVRYPRIIGGMKLIERHDAEDNPIGFMFAFPQKALDSIEAFLHQRYQNYDTIVWHHRVVKTEALLNRTISDLGIRYLKDSDQAPNTTSRKLPSNVSGLWVPFSELEHNGLIAKKQMFGQWNDAWLMSTLTGEYIDLCEKREVGTGFTPEDNLLYGRLAELLYAEHYYISLVKRYGEIAEAEDDFICAIKDSGRDIEEMWLKLSKRAGYGTHGVPVTEPGKAFDANGTARNLLALLPPVSTLDTEEQSSIRNPLILARMHYESFSVSCGDYKTYEDLISGIVEEVVSALLPDRQVIEHIVVFRHLDSGVDDDGGPTLFVPEGRPSKLDELSRVGAAIQYEERLRPPFYVYVRFAGGKELSTKQEDSLRRRFVKGVATKLAEWYLRMYDAFIARASY